MLKHLYKTLLISVISGSLLSFSPAITLAAEEGQTQTTTDNNGVITAKKSYKFDKISDADMMASIGMLGAGLIAARMAIVYNKPLAMDAMIAGAAGAAFIAGEVASSVKFKGEIKEMTIEVEKKNNGEVNEEQVKRLQDLKKSYEEAKKTTNVKKMLQLGAAAGFGAAAATAGYLAHTEYLLMSNCIAAVQASVASCPNNADYLAKMTTLNETRQYPSPSTIKERTSMLNLPPLSTPLLCIPKSPPDAAAGTALTQAANTACTPAIVALKKNQVFTYYDIQAVTKANNSYEKLLFKNSSNIAFNEVSKKTFINHVLDFFIARADAGWTQLFGLGTGAAIAFGISTFAIAKQLDLWIYVPFNRAVAFAALGAIALLASKSSADVMKKLDANIAKIDAILADLNKLSKGVKAQNITPQGISISTVNPNAIAPPVSFSTDNSVKTPCMTSNSSENCKPLANQLSAMPGFANLPDSFKDIASQTVALGDSVSGTKGISGSALASAESLGNKQAAIAKLVKSTQEKLNKVSNGKLNTDKSKDKFSKTMAATIKKSLAKSGWTATGLMGAIGSTPIDSSLADKNDDIKKGSGIGAGANAINLQAGAGDGKDSDMLKLDFKEQAPGDGLSMGEVATSGEAPKEYDMNSTEINGKFGPSLFELISGRYIKSGYPKLLEEEPSKN